MKSGNYMFGVICMTKDLVIRGRAKQQVDVIILPQQPLTELCKSNS